MYASVNSGGVGKFGTFDFSSTSTFTQIGSDDPLFKTMVLATYGTSIFGLYYDQLYNYKVYSINPSTGTPTFVANVTNGGLFLKKNLLGASIIDTAPVPEPSTYALAAIATGALAFIARRRKAKGS
jgi:hypothetical protein